MGRECSFCVVVIALALVSLCNKREINESSELRIAQGSDDKSGVLDFFALIG